MTQLRIDIKKSKVFNFINEINELTNTIWLIYNELKMDT